MIRELTCIVCPKGCQLKAEIENGEVINVTGFTCPRGKQGGSCFRIPTAETPPVAPMSWLPSGGPAAPSLHASPAHSPVVGVVFYLS